MTGIVVFVAVSYSLGESLSAAYSWSVMGVFGGSIVGIGGAAGSTYVNPTLIRFGLRIGFLGLLGRALITLRERPLVSVSGLMILALIAAIGTEILGYYLIPSAMKPPLTHPRGKRPESRKLHSAAWLVKEGRLAFRHRGVFSSLGSSGITALGVVAILSRSPHAPQGVAVFPGLAFLLIASYNVTRHLWQQELPMMSVWRWVGIPWGQWVAKATFTILSSYGLFMMGFWGLLIPPLILSFC